jgi:hypothetical protein
MSGLFSFRMRPGSRYLRDEAGEREGPIEYERPFFVQDATSLVAASDSANTPIIALDGHGPAAPATIPIVTVAAIASVFIAVFIAVTVITRATDFYPEAGSLNVRTLSKGRHRGRSSHCTHEAERDQRSGNPLHVAFLPVLSL